MQERWVVWGRWLDCRQRKGDGPRGRGGEVVLDKEFVSNIITVRWKFEGTCARRCPPKT